MIDLSEIKFTHRMGADWDTEPYTKLVEKLCSLEWDQRVLQELSDEDLKILARACYGKWSDHGPSYLRAQKKLFDKYSAQIYEDCLLFRNNEDPITPPALRELTLFVQKVADVMKDSQYDSERNKFLGISNYKLHSNIRRGITEKIIANDETMSMKENYDKIFRRLSRILDCHRFEMCQIFSAMVTSDESAAPMITYRKEERRTPRLAKLQRYREKSNRVEIKVMNADEAGFQKIRINEKIGYGLIALKAFKYDDYLIECAGAFISEKEGKAREHMYSKNPEIGCFLFFFKFRSQSYCIDATEDTGRLARWANHSKTSPNAKVKVEYYGGRPRLLLYALKDIDAGEQILFDYGDRNPRALRGNSWLKK